MKLLVHHHAPVYQDGESYYIQAFIGCWIQELCKHFDEVGLLLHRTESRTTKQDFEVRSSKIKLLSLGPNQGFKNRGERLRHIKKVCQAHGADYDALIIRGITPRQRLVYRAVSTPKKFFLLVGSIVDGKPRLKLNPRSVFSSFMFRLRLKELKEISKGAQMLANSPKIADEIRDVLKTQATFIPTNSISRSHFARVKRDYDDPVLRLLFVGRVEEAKGIVEVFEAFENLELENDQNAHLDVVGPISEALKNRLMGMLSSDKRDKVVFHGFVPFGEELMKFYRDSHYYLLPSYHEGFPHSIWEAGASLTPIITTRVGGIPGLISDEHVTFVSVRSSVGIVDAIGELQLNDNLRTEKSERLFKYAQSFTIEEAVIKLAASLRN